MARRPVAAVLVAGLAVELEVGVVAAKGAVMVAGLEPTKVAPHSEAAGTPRAEVVIVEGALVMVAAEMMADLGESAVSEVGSAESVVLELKGIALVSSALASEPPQQ